MAYFLIKQDRFFGAPAGTSMAPAAPSGAALRLPARSDPA